MKTLEIVTDLIESCGLSINASKTQIKNVSEEAIDWLGFNVQFDSEGQLELSLTTDCVDNLKIEINRAVNGSTYDTRPWERRQYDIEQHVHQVVTGWFNHYAPAITVQDIPKVIKYVKRIYQEARMDLPSSKSLRGRWEHSLKHFTEHWNSILKDNDWTDRLKDCHVNGVSDGPWFTEACDGSDLLPPLAAGGSDSSEVSEFGQASVAGDVSDASREVSR